MILGGLFGPLFFCWQHGAAPGGGEILKSLDGLPFPRVLVSEF
jgi:hypothetical protein